MNYSKLGWTAVIAAFAASIGAAPASAKGGSAKPKQPTVRVTSAKAKPVKTVKSGPSTMAGAKTKAPTSTVRVASASGAKAKANGSRTATGKPAVAKKEGAPAPTLSAKGSQPTLSAKEPQAPAPGAQPQPPTLSAKEPQPTDTNPRPTLPLNKAQQLLMKNDNLRLKMQTRLGGLDPVLAASGFRNLGQFVAAVNASYNDPSIQFLALKALMTGTPSMSLGQAKQQLKAPLPTTTVTTVITPSDQR